MLNWLKRRRRRSLHKKPWPDEWQAILQRNVRHYNLIDSALQEHMQRCTRVIVEEKHWEGLDGLSISDEIKVTVAGQASVMLLGTEGYFFDGVKSFLIFPRAFRRKTRNGWVVDEDSHNAGEAWQGGPIVLSWHDVMAGSRYPDDGQNLVIHELAHHLDGIDGEMGGGLTFSDRATNQKWERISNREFAALQTAAHYGQPTLLDHYGATNEAEFFAVASETFFELPIQFRRLHPELFEMLKRYYRIDPIQWQRL